MLGLADRCTFDESHPGIVEARQRLVDLENLWRRRFVFMTARWFCPRAERSAAFALVQRFPDDVFAVRFHRGGDEAGSRGST